MEGQRKGGCVYVRYVLYLCTISCVHGYDTRGQMLETGCREVDGWVGQGAVSPS